MKKLKGHGPEAAPLLILLSVLPKLLYPAFYPEHSEGPIATKLQQDCLWLSGSKEYEDDRANARQ